MKELCRHEWVCLATALRPRREPRKSPKNGEYGDERMISIAGMFPAEDPEYVVVVSFVKPQTNRFSYAVAPAFDAIVTQILAHYRVAPSSQTAGYPPLTW